jgi:MYXO-CTERM domain-containing protein
MRGERMRDQLDALVRDWDQAALPRQGRYVREPAVIDEQGVRHVPPPVADPQLAIVAGIGLLAVAGILLMRRRAGGS